METLSWLNNMKRFFLLFILNLFFLNSFTQELLIPQDTVAGYIKCYELSNSQSIALQTVQKEWRKEYSKILKEQKIKLDCGACESLYIDVILSINSNGKLEYYKPVSSDKCGEKFSKGFEIRFMKWFFNYKFPESLFNLKIEVRLGDSLRC